MIISCTSCGVRYRFDETVIEGEGKKVKCVKCGTIFHIHPPDMDQDQPASGSDSASIDTTKTVNSQELLDGAPGLMTAEGQRVSLAILSGSLAGQVFQITKRVTVLGRASGDINLPDPETSRKHCQVEIKADGVFLKDLGSTNGTSIDGKAIQQVSLDDKSEFVIGSTSIMLIISSD